MTALVLLIGLPTCQAAPHAAIGKGPPVATVDPDEPPAGDAKSQVDANVRDSSTDATENPYPIVEGDPNGPSAQRLPGKIRCGTSSCTVGAEVCCASQGPGDSVCVRVPASENFDLTGLDAFCDQRGALLVACNDSAACGETRVCCEIMWGSGQNEPVVCDDPRPGERFPCVYREACVPDVPCRTHGAQCVDGWCVVERPPPRLQCGRGTCTAASPICCERPDGHLECTTEAQCLPDSGKPYACTRPADCAAGEFCGVTTVAAACTHTWDGMTAILCEAVADCPRDFGESCAGRGGKLTCATMGGAALPGQRECGCRD